MSLVDRKYLWLAIAMLAQSALSQSDTIVLWPKGAPGAIHASDYAEERQFDEAGKLRGFSKVSHPDLTAFLLKTELATGTAILICPGGGYSHLAIEKEGYRVARWLRGLGIAAFVLKYRMPSDKTMTDKTVGPLQDAQKALRIIRRNASNWGIDPNRVGVMGFSAGGHLAATLSTHYDAKVYEPNDTVSARPDFSVLVYPVISMEQGITHTGSRQSLLGDNPTAALVEHYSNEKKIDSSTPLSFLVHSTDDGAVPVENSIKYYLALKDRKVSAEMHLYQDGGHGFGLGTHGTHTEWPATLKRWLRAENLIPEKEVLLFSYFTGNGEDGLHLAHSDDGLTWKALNDGRSFIRPVVGKDSLMRDPCIIRSGDGKYHMVWTVSWTDKGIGYATSKDLINWSAQRFLPVMSHEPSTRNTWAPEITYDAESGEYMIYWASTVPGKFPETQSDKENGYNHRMYYTTTENFETFTDTELLYEPGFNVIDATIVKDGDRYVMFLKDETREPPQKNIKMAYADSLTGPYSEASPPITGNYWAEGPTVLNLDGKWTVYFDKYVDKKYGAVQSLDLQEWNDISDQIEFPKGARHGLILKVPISVLEGIQQHAGD
jgi:acetyl esterase/lipase